ncbi:Putative ABC transporter substrate-binding protein YesO [Paenibacillus solanacearum]|uniref:ABC transporter substrate-binding protein YesO n=1 Tax=Paenibacillus solanacearum TaxID=2048548 RepID=A0A916K480_9BACL|nr:extracellular solute-binding protein [Paenibacillus solanacearum]CAG7640751.1 Putative ABC transporter substrate-binding protein YesO [Paenibacillus solanacearum]
MSIRKKAVLFAFGCLIASGCSAGGNPGAQPGNAPAAEKPAENAKPVTLQVFQAGGSISDTEFKELIAEPVKKKFPHITMELIREGQAKRDQLITAGEFPDLIFTSSISMNGFLELNLMKDLQEMINKSKLDMNQYEKRAIDQIKSLSDNGQMYALPFSINYGALFYNKDIFDRAGIPYPAEGLAWEDLLDLARKVAEKEPSVRVLGTSGITRDAISLRFPLVDPKAEKPILANDDWKWLLEFHQSLNKLPDNKQAKGGRDGFVKDRTMAMYTSYGARIGELEEMEQSGQSFKWDLTTFPVRRDAKVQGMETESHILSVSSMAKHPEEAFNVITFLTTNDEVQTQVARKARVSSLKADKYKTLFGQDLKSLQGKNVQAIFKNKYGPNAQQTKYDAAAEKAINSALSKVNSGKADVNTALREAEEEASKGIAELKLADKK